MQMPSHHGRRRSARLLRACCGVAVVGLLLPAVDDLVAFTANLWSPPRRPSAVSAANARGQLERPSRVSRHAIDLDAVQVAASIDALGSASELFDSTLLTSFSDQAGNINGVLFQSSLPAYLLFLYFLSYRGNNTPPLVQFGFGFLLCFVLLTIPTGIISKSSYGLILADSDWLHGSAESLLTCTNIMIVLGFRGALLGDKDMADNSVVRNVALVWLATVIATLASGIPVFGFEAHTPFLSGLGALPAESFAAEPVNALSIPNWMVHWSTVFEFLLAMSLAWRYGDASGNQKWKGLTWGMFPSSISSVCALTFHVFYNQIPWILTAQALFTFIGNATLALASYRIASSNGWTLSELDPRPALSKAFAKVTGGTDEEKSADEPSGFDVSRVSKSQADKLISGPLLVAEGLLLTVAFAYGTKYGELTFGVDVFQSPESNLAAALVVLLPVSLVGYTIYSNSADLRSGQVSPLALASSVTQEVAPGASAASVKKE
eukprot:gb/GFBE01031309.1/.p1 GENE.gb/GFBE01031309.1/~~gb/GFBE01031309.1/.p1  ORF type:complete len:492 (+),score=88.27 gb/GFBE01031309.1/:1-1476(+)